MKLEAGMAGDLRAQHKAQLREAYALIKAERCAEAYELIAPVLVQQPDYMDAWWLAAHAAPNLRLAMAACQKVLALKPDHAQAQLMLEELRRRAAIEAHLGSQEKLRRRTAQPRARPRRTLFWILLIAALIVFPVAALSILAVTTGETLGLPIGQFFSFEQDVPFVALIAANDSGSFGTPSKVVRVGTLPIGARHAYRFNVPRGNTMLWLEVDFRLTSSDQPPYDAIRLLLPTGALQPPRDSVEAPKTITYYLPFPGVYTLELIGKPSAKSFYRISFVLLDIGDAIR
ncbi:MAG: hypothetical protein CUN49_01575 [Candidatus Thermofonsia Clade 1 bacterium]|jgi:hypothetical protein|uniref:Tetratricopeptide repeat protein n=1 Tax=Candidatus Thermofonsia Clade 1 bacterium TaxID=2364210 RepID=A0A2M8PI04_9CHLR|nr:MAG: hypothetical protein CUN49_01575 [Candidatus Thermofonsia Clade 1 bacterium]RMF53647.1 MAG: hypothetical protein D6749_01755 [Chloroflexota bacterium]